MNKRLNFAIEEFNFVEEDFESQFATVEIEAFSSGMNRHDLDCPVELLKSTAPTIYKKPIVFELNQYMADFGGHADNENDRRIAGFIESDSAEFFERPDGRTGLRVKGKIWKYYADWALDVFKTAADMVKKVSVEMLMGEPDGNTMTDFEYTGVSLLGDMLTEASPGAQARLLSFSTDCYNEACKAEFAKYSDTDFSIPDGVKKNCQDGLDIYDEFNTGGTTVALAMARYIVKNETITPQKVRKIANYFAAHGGREKPSDIESKDFVAWQLYGGIDGKDWSKNLVDEINAIDEELVAYFDKKILLSKEGGESNNADHTSEEKEMKDMEDIKETEVFEKEDDQKDEEVTMESDKEESPKSEDMAKEEEDEKEEMASPEEDKEDDKEEMASDESDEEEMACDEKKYESLFAEATEKLETLEAENAELREFKANVEKQAFESEVNSLLNEVKEIFSKKELEELRDDAVENYSLETISGWTNLVKAKAFETSKDSPEKKEEDNVDGNITKMDIPNSEDSKPEKSDKLW